MSRAEVSELYLVLNNHFNYLKELDRDTAPVEVVSSDLRIMSIDLGIMDKLRPSITSLGIESEQQPVRGRKAPTGTWR